MIENLIIGNKTIHFEMSRRRNDTPKTSPADIQRREDAQKYARQLRASGLYVWADQWDWWSRQPSGTPQPPNFHNEPAHGFDPTTMKMYPETLETMWGSFYYRRWLDRENRRSPSTTGFRAGGGCGTVSVVKGDVPRYREEKSNAELGRIRDKNDNPTQLINKLRDLKKKYPQIYAKNDGTLI